jgi:prepilin-type N-terminal cleavage/methylation domain-containing protein
MNRRGFTLIETLVSLVLSLAVAAFATIAYHQSNRLAKSAIKRLEMHNSARMVHQLLHEDLGAMLQTCAVFVETAASTAGPGQPPNATISLTFMRGRFDLHEFSPSDEWGAYNFDNTDTMWVRWTWDQRAQLLKRAASSKVINHWPAASWTFGGFDFRERYFVAFPQPHRAWGGNVQDTLNYNKWNTGQAGDLGDDDDLRARLIPVARGVSDFRLQIVPADGGTPTDITASTTGQSGIDGCFIDGSAGGLPYRKRPALVRVRFTLLDPGTLARLPFTFSIPCPGIQPPR